MPLGRSARTLDAQESSTRARKNTRRWCRGVQGREHDVTGWIGVSGPYDRLFTMRKCRACGRIMETHWWSYPRPDWEPKWVTGETTTQWRVRRDAALRERCLAILAEKPWGNRPWGN